MRRVLSARRDRTDGFAHMTDRKATVRRLVNAFIVALLPLTLVGVSVHQIYLATTAGLTPWKGGGFGMFSSTDRSSHRAVRGFFETDIGLVSVDMYSLDRPRNSTQAKAFINARALPDERRLRPWLDVVTCAEWTVDDDVASFATWLPDDAAMIVQSAGDDLDVEAVWIQVWASSYDKSTKTIVPRIVSSYRFELQP
jgi:hypothetical protein